MRAIIIDDKDAKALLDGLKLAEFSKQLGYGVELQEAWHSLPEITREAIFASIHAKFHYVVCTWLQDQGAKVT